MRFSVKSNIERLWCTSKVETFHLLVTKMVADLEIIAFHVRRQQKFVADLDEMSHQGMPVHNFVWKVRQRQSWSREIRHEQRLARPG